MNNNLRAVAEAAGVSLSTASRVFTNASIVSPDVRVRVLTASQQLGYHPRERMRRPVESSLQRVVLYVRAHNRFILPSMLGDFYGYVLQGIEAECRRQGLVLVFAHDGGDGLDAAHLQQLGSSNDTGVLLVGPCTAVDVAAAQAQGLPVVLLNNMIEQPVDAVLPDYYGGAQLVVRHVIAAGHRRIAYLHGQERYTTRLRMQGYRDTLAEAGLAFDPALVTQSSMSLQSASDAVAQLLERDVDFTALVCVNDISAVGASNALVKYGRQPGVDVALLGFDDLDLSGLTRMQLTTVHVPKLEMGAVAVRRLQERALDTTGAPQRIIMGVHLVERDTMTRIAG